MEGLRGAAVAGLGADLIPEIAGKPNDGIVIRESKIIDQSTISGVNHLLRRCSHHIRGGSKSYEAQVYPIHRPTKA
jgi:hypothetical protein